MKDFITIDEAISLGAKPGDRVKIDGTGKVSKSSDGGATWVTIKEPELPTLTAPASFNDLKFMV